MIPVESYQQHLDRVSRSFAFCIAELEEPLRPWVGLTYLLCRLLDTIEDAAWENSETQSRQFDQFDRFLLSGGSEAEIRAWGNFFPGSISAGEKALVEDAFRLFNDLHSSEFASARPVIQSLGRDMSSGMRVFCRTLRQGGAGEVRLRLNSLAEVDRYCFVVAGIVGEALARLLNQVDSRFSLSIDRLRDAQHFGLFLQKVNLLKDQLTDEREGRHLIPDRSLVRISAKENLEGAYRFFHSLPSEQKGFRLFCAWSLFLGLGTLAVVESAFRENRSAKLDRGDAEELLKQVRNHLDQPVYLEKLFLDLGMMLEMDLSSWRTQGAAAMPSLL
jgi:phytoene/squalene synthetase